MTPLSYTALTDGSSDRRLIPVITWALQQHSRRPVVASWADLWFVRPRPATLSERIRAANDNYPADLLFIHRDAEGESYKFRFDEIQAAAEGLELPPVVEVITVRMQEAWFLFDERAIRAAAGNPNGSVELNLPAVVELEALPDPKARLWETLRMASELPAHRRKRFHPPTAAHRLSDLIEQFSPLRALSAFVSFEDRLVQRIAAFDG